MSQEESRNGAERSGPRGAVLLPRPVVRNRPAAAASLRTALAGLLVLAQLACQAGDQPPATPEKKEGSVAGKGDKAKPDPKRMSPAEAEKAGFCVVDRKEHKLVYHAEHEGQEYHFCSRECQKLFKANPAQFVARGAAEPGGAREVQPARPPKQDSAKAPPESKTPADPKKKDEAGPAETGDGMQGMGGEKDGMQQSDP